MMDTSESSKANKARKAKWKAQIKKEDARRDEVHVLFRRAVIALEAMVPERQYDVLMKRMAKDLPKMMALAKKMVREK